MRARLKALLSALRDRGPRPEQMFQEEGYVIAREARLAGLFERVAPESLAGKRVLEVGAGHGDLGAVLETHGAVVTSVEGRPEHVQQLRKKYPHREANVYDANSPALTALGRFDVVFAFGILYHLADPARFLASCAQMADDLLLETQVVDLLEPAILSVTESSFYDQSLDQRGSRPSPPWIERELRALGYQQVVDISSSRANFVTREARAAYDWVPTGSAKYKLEDGTMLRKMWVATKHAKTTVDGKIWL